MNTYICQTACGFGVGKEGYFFLGGGGGWVPNIIYDNYKSMLS